MNNKFIGLLFSCLFLTACSTLPVDDVKRKELPDDRKLAFKSLTDVNNAKIIVTRDSGFVASACYYGFWVDGTLAGRFAPKESAAFYVPSGERVFKFGRDPNGKGACSLDKKIGNQIETIVDEKVVKSYRLTLDGSGFPSIQRDN
ncbi:hypothetical protein ACG95N_09630 [Acinetobacter guillouiae]|uniref:hypothetical protein n=1 Tax=Acinetobacter guillouiae TaxID=106649 RepID=UPI003AF5F921